MFYPNAAAGGSIAPKTATATTLSMASLLEIGHTILIDLDQPPTNMSIRSAFRPYRIVS